MIEYILIFFLNTIPSLFTSNCRHFHFFFRAKITFVVFVLAVVRTTDGLVMDVTFLTSTRLTLCVTALTSRTLLSSSIYMALE